MTPRGYVVLNTTGERVWCGPAGTRDSARGKAYHATGIPVELLTTRGTPWTDAERRRFGADAGVVARVTVATYHSLPTAHALTFLVYP